MSLASITQWEMHITAQGPHLRNDLYCVEWDVKLYYIIPFHTLKFWLNFDSGKAYAVILFMCYVHNN